MAEEITNKMLLDHIQAMRNGLEQKIEGLDGKIEGLDQKIDRVEQRLDAKITNLAIVVQEGFEDARLHRQALQEDLEATMRVQSKHAATLSRIAHPHSASS